MSLARSAAALVFLFCGLTQAQQIPKYEPDAQISYNRIRDVTWYSSDSILLSGAGASMELGFGCVGDTGESPCVPSQVTLSFMNAFSRSIDHTRKELFILADRERFQGRLRVTYNTNLREYVAETSISLALLRQLAKAESIEIQVGHGEASLSKEDIGKIGSFFNMAVLNAKQNAPATRSKSRRRKPLKT